MAGLLDILVILIVPNFVSVSVMLGWNPVEGIEIPFLVVYLATLAWRWRSIYLDFKEGR